MHPSGNRVEAGLQMCSCGCTVFLRECCVDDDANGSSCCARGEGVGRAYLNAIHPLSKRPGRW
jgi:hypothetical protein